MSDSVKKVVVTLCPPAEQEIFFQEIQFDEELGHGTDPYAYAHGSLPSSSIDDKTVDTKVVKKKRLKEAERVLEGHENKEEILKILRTE